MSDITSFHPWGASFMVRLGHFSQATIIYAHKGDVSRLEHSLLARPRNYYLDGHVSLCGFKTEEDMLAFRDQLIMAYHRVWVEPMTRHIKVLKMLAGKVPLEEEYREELEAVRNYDKSLPVLPIHGIVELELGPTAMYRRREHRDGRWWFEKTPVSEEDTLEMARYLPKLALESLAFPVGRIHLPMGRDD